MWQAENASRLPARCMLLQLQALLQTHTHCGALRGRQFNWVFRADWAAYHHCAGVLHLLATSIIATAHEMATSGGEVCKKAKSGSVLATLRRLSSGQKEHITHTPRGLSSYFLDFKAERSVCHKGMDYG